MFILLLEIANDPNESPTLLTEVRGFPVATTAGAIRTLRPVYRRYLKLLSADTQLPTQ